ncbi:ATP synthase F0 subunit B [Desulfosarcina sp. OttesenSCG-928-A07]|nr:ATP synthase F0 subunit B [Desulfosarcina sp. OttesenSCG-928-G17]MDL2328267.1 ATP synthase F0 subunit B [Desulfosarcina sp. OttesenSCG-928-A07]
MKVNRRKRRCQNQTSGVPILVFMVVVLAPGIAAASGSGDWRETWDTVMAWVNFSILAGVIFKFGRVPIKDFLAGQRSAISAELTALEEEKEKCLAEIDSARRHTDENRQRLAEMKERLISQGEARKQALIDQARSQAALMIQSVRTKMENHILMEKEKLKMELADMAFEQAAKSLPGVITDADNAMWIGNYMEEVNS